MDVCFITFASQVDNLSLSVFFYLSIFSFLLRECLSSESVCPLSSSILWGKRRLCDFDRFVCANVPHLPKGSRHKWTLVKCECTSSVPPEVKSYLAKTEIKKKNCGRTGTWTWVKSEDIKDIGSEEDDTLFSSILKYRHLRS